MKAITNSITNFNLKLRQIVQKVTRFNDFIEGELLWSIVNYTVKFKMMETYKTINLMLYIHLWGCHLLQVILMRFVYCDSLIGGIFYTASWVLLFFCHKFSCYIILKMHILNHRLTTLNLTVVLSLKVYKLSFKISFSMQKTNYYFFTFFTQLLPAV